MAFLILANRAGEFDRRDLIQPMVIGRALDCDICIRDIELSRRHCRIEPFDERWVVVDLGSKNGTHVGKEVVTRHVLRDGEVIRIGKSHLCFRESAFIPAPVNTTPRPAVRAADPIEALSSTVLGFQVFDMEEDSRVSGGFPIPKPRPAEPVGFRRDAVHSIVTQIASDSWDLELSDRLGPVRPRRKSRGTRPRAPRPRLSTRLQRLTAGTYVALACVVGAILLMVVLVKSVWAK